MSDAQTGASAGDATEPQADAETLVGEGASSGDPERLVRGTRMGHFEIERMLGRGGMGVVYAARDTKLDRRVAIKLVLGAFAGSVGSERRARLEREARALARLSHPNVVQVFETGEHDGQLYIVMEFVDGTTLDQKLQAMPVGPHRWRDVLALMLPAGDGLVAAHAAGLVHRDFKPENVLVEGTGRVRVMDFGVAHASESALLAQMDAATAPTAANLALTQTGALVGTPAYMSPEQFRGAKLDARSDQFAYCVVLYEALFGRRPFAGATVAELLAKVLEGPEPSFQGAPVPSPIADALRRGLSRDPELRFSSMGELLDALRQSLSRPASARRGAGRMLGLLVSFAAVGGATLWVLRDEAGAPASETATLAPTSDVEGAPPSPVGAPAAEPIEPTEPKAAPKGGASPGGGVKATLEPSPGTLAMDDIREVVRANVSQVRECYDAALQKDPNASGRVVISVVIGLAGNVESARTTESDLRDPFLGSCIAGKMMTWRFPAPKGGTVTVNYPFVLSSE